MALGVLSVKGFSSGFSQGQFVDFHIDTEPAKLRLRFDLRPDLDHYYVVEVGRALDSFVPEQLVYGGGPDIRSVVVRLADHPQLFWRVRRVPVASAFDLDGDGMDDHYESSHGLAPLDPGDASLSSGFVDLDGSPLTWLETYRLFFTRNLQIFDSVSREISAFNFGQPTASHEALSREVSLFNTPPPDTDADGIDDEYERIHGLPIGVSDAFRPSGFMDDFPMDSGRPLTWAELYRLNFGPRLPLYHTVSREWSVFNFAESPTALDSVSREVSIFNVPSPDANADGIDDAYAANHGLTQPGAADQMSGFRVGFPAESGPGLRWREFYRLTFGMRVPVYDVVAREVSVFNFGQSTANHEALSREVSGFNLGQPTANFEALSREVSVFNIP